MSDTKRNMFLFGGFVVLCVAAVGYVAYQQTQRPTVPPLEERIEKAFEKQEQRNRDEASEIAREKARITATLEDLDKRRDALLHKMAAAKDDAERAAVRKELDALDAERKRVLGIGP